MGWSSVQRSGLTHHQPARSTKGYTLCAPLGGDSAYLLDMDGRVVHRWVFDNLSPACVRLLPNGNLMAMGVTRDHVRPEFEVGQEPPPMPERAWMVGGHASQLLEVDWDGETVWQYDNALIHHDFVPLPTGNILLSETVEIPEDLQRKVRGGARRPREKMPRMMGDDIIEIDRAGREQWRVHTWELFDPTRDPLCPLETRWEWTHLNSLDVTDDGDVVFSCRQNSRVGIINRATGQLTWKTGANVVSHQHHATALPNGNIQIFDNGMHRLAEMSYSRLVEIDPTTDEIVWQYAAIPQEAFFSGHISGAQRLSGGNVLVCEGSAGRIFEISPGGETVWEWINPFQNRVHGRIGMWIFRAYRYDMDFPGLRDRRLDPFQLVDFNRQHGLARGGRFGGRSR